MTEQPEALRVAQALEVKHSPGVVLTVETVLDAASLLREQHKEIARLENRNARLEDRIDWIEKGLAEWRDEALLHMQRAKAEQATARVAIRHLKAVLAECAYDPVRVDMEARDWLVSIGDAAIDAALEEAK